MRTAAALLLALAACSHPPRPGTAEGTTPPDARDTPSAETSPPSADTAAASTPSADPACGTDSPEALGACVEIDRIARDLETVAGIRTPGSPHWQAVQDLCAQRFAAAGFTVERQPIDGGVNVIGRQTGTARPSETVVVSAHYDHIADCPGADDNASGVAGLLETARLLGGRPAERTLVVACWDREEDGMIGSRHWVAGLPDRAETVTLSLVYEMIGYRDRTPGSQRVPPGVGLLFPALERFLVDREYRGDFLALVANQSAAGAVARLEAAARRAELPAAAVVVPDRVAADPLLRDLSRSDHDPFWVARLPAVMLTDTADFRYDRYHCAAGPDSPDRLDPAFAAAVVRAAVETAAAELERPDPTPAAPPAEDPDAPNTGAAAGLDRGIRVQKRTMQTADQVVAAPHE